MPCRLPFWGFLAIALLALACAPAARADWPADGECAGLRRELARAVDAREFSQASTAGTTLFAHCSPEPEDWDPLSAKLAQALRESGRDDEAIAVIDRCLARQARSPNCLQERGLLLRKLGRPAAAQQAFQAAQRLGAAPPDLPEEPRAQIIAQPRNPRPGAQRGDKAGSGFFVNHGGDIVTNAHVVSGCGHIETSDKATLKIIGSDADIDLAVLHADLSPADIASLRAAPPPRIGEDVLAFGFPLPGLLSTEGNVTIGILSATRGVGDDPHVFQMTAPVQSGNSGGPLVDMSGNVVGVVVSKLDAATVSQRTGDVPQNVNFAIKAGEVAAFLDRVHVAYSAGRLGERKEAADLAEATKKFAVQIICFGG
jgi:S1-C subfamily serine protease